MARYYFIPRRFRHSLPISQRIVWRLEAWVVDCFLWVFRLLPIRLALRAGGWLFGLMGPFSARADKVRKNLMVAFPDRDERERDRLVRDSFRHLGLAMVELARLDQIWREREQRIEFVVRPGAKTPMPNSRAVYVTAHIGAWQLTPLIGQHYGFTIPVIYAPEENPFVDRKLAELRAAFGSPLVSRDGGIRVLMKALDRGQSIGVTVDTRMDAGEPLPFFGEEAPTNTAPARLALRYGCDMVPVYAQRLPGARYRVSICPPIRPADPDAGVAEQASDMTRQLNGLFETWVREQPGEWLCLKRRWYKDVYRRLS